MNCVCFGDVLLMRTLCDAIRRNLNLISVQSWTYLKNAEPIIAVSGRECDIVVGYGFKKHLFFKSNVPYIKLVKVTHKQKHLKYVLLKTLL